MRLCTCLGKFEVMIGGIAGAWAEPRRPQSARRPHPPRNSTGELDSGKRSRQPKRPSVRGERDLPTKGPETGGRRTIRSRFHSRKKADVRLPLTISLATYDHYHHLRKKTGAAFEAIGLLLKQVDESRPGNLEYLSCIKSTFSQAYFEVKLSKAMHSSHLLDPPLPYPIINTLIPASLGPDTPFSYSSDKYLEGGNF